jgi:Yip1 domain
LPTFAVQSFSPSHRRELIMSTTAPVTTQGAEPLSEPQRLINTFIAPTKTFADLTRKPSWWAPWLISAILSVLLGYMLGQKVGFDQLAENAVKMSPRDSARLDRASPEDRAQEMQMRTAMTKGIYYAFPVIIVVSALIMAGVLLGTFNFGMGARIPFKTALAVVFYAFVPFAVLGNLIALAAIAAPGFAPEGFNPQNPTATNLAAFMDPSEASPAVYALATGVDIFNVWTVVLLGIGFSVVGNLKRSTAIWTVTLWLVAWKLIQAGLLSLGG